MTDRIDHLIARHLEGTLDAAQLAELNAALAADPAARDLLIQSALHARLIATRIGNAELGSPRTEPLATLPARPAPTPTLRPPKRLVLLAAATLLLAACGVAIVLISLNPKPETPNPKPAAHPIATVIDTADDSTLTVNDAIANPGDEIDSGEYTLDAGAADLRLSSGVGVTLRGDTHLTVHDPMSAALARGTATFDCPPVAKGYTVHLPRGARVVDLGTRFRVTVDEAGRYTAHVLEGAVDLHAIDGVHRLTAGSSAALGEGVGTVIDTPGLLLDAGFEDADESWSIRGNAHLAPNNTARAAAGQTLLAFNTGEQPPTGVAEQTFATEPGRRYELTYKLVKYGGNPGEARIRAVVADADDDSAAPMLDATDAVSVGTTQPHGRYTAVAHRFTAAGDHAVLRLSDTSTNNGHGFDLYVDDARIVPLPDEPAPDDAAQPPTTDPAE